MVCSIPTSWKYSDELEMLFLFYQSTDELLSESTPDSYTLPLHNSWTLIREIREIYYILQKNDLIKTYYSNYIPVIIDEFLNSIKEDYLLKKELGLRLHSIETGLMEAKKNHILLLRWLDVIEQTCTKEKYKNLYEAEIINLVQNTKDKKKLLYCSKSYYSSLIDIGYSREFLYIANKKFFDNYNMTINASKQIEEYISQFDCKPKEYEFLILMNIDTLEYLGAISQNSRISENIEKIDVKKARKELCEDNAVKQLFNDYDTKSREGKDYETISIVRYKVDAIDPYEAIEQLEQYTKFLQTFGRYFKHYYPKRQIYKVLLLSNHYIEIRTPNILLKRPFIQQEVVDMRIRNILHGKSMSFPTVESLAMAIQMHSEALDSTNTNTLLRNFWTSLETLFSNPNSSSQRDNVINSTLIIIQKLYLLKLFRIIYLQLTGAINGSELKTLGIRNFEEFIIYFSSNKESSDEMKKIYTLLTCNPLLRTRIYQLRKDLSTGSDIAQYLEKHKIRIEWQLERLYRARNIATHLGREIYYNKILVNHLHNYFDFATNYIICKSENEDYISSVSSLVFEAKNDNVLHTEILKSNSELSDSNYINYLFGPDENIINYAFEC